MSAQPDPPDLFRLERMDLLRKRLSKFPKRLLKTHGTVPHHHLLLQEVISGIKATFCYLIYSLLGIHIYNNFSFPLVLSRLCLQIGLFSMKHILHFLQIFHYCLWSLHVLCDLFRPVSEWFCLGRSAFRRGFLIP